MGFGSEILHMMIIIIFILVSLIDGKVLNAAEDFNVHGDRIGYYIQKVSGEDESEEKGALIVEKFRALLGLKSFHIRNPSHRGPENMPPSPSPSPTIEAEALSPAPVPVPVLHIHGNPHHPSHSSNIPLHDKAQKQNRDKDRVRTILVAVILSAGAVFLACALGLIWVCKKRRKQREKPTRIISVYSKKGGTRGKLKNVSAQNSASKVSRNPGLDLFYLNALGKDLEEQTCLKQITEPVNTSSYDSTHKCTMHEMEEQNQELVKVESDNASSSSTREITSVHEDAESITYESDGGNSSSGGKTIPVECHSSDDESFHSFGESLSWKNVRLSNASAGSLSEKSDVFSTPQESQIKRSLLKPLDIEMPPQSSCYPKPEKQTVECFSDSQNSLKHPSPSPPPPQPPPPPPRMTCFPPPSSTRITSKASCSFTLPNLSSPRNSYSSSGSNRTPQRETPSSTGNPPKPSQSQTPSHIPPPPCPPPFLQGNNNSTKGPPPPPSQLPRFTPLGKDGAPLAKLKPLHWDKVRAAPDRSMVWDKLRSSSFE
jgi:hypothetical protein